MTSWVIRKSSTIAANPSRALRKRGVEGLSVDPLACSPQALSLGLREKALKSLPNSLDENRLFGRCSCAVMPLCAASYSSADAFDIGEL